MVTWLELSRERPEMAADGKALLYQHGVGLAFLSTIRPDGRPRLHPVCPLLTDTALFAFIIPSPKQSDLRRDGWYALHSFPCPANEDAVYLTGRADLVTDTNVRETLAAQFVAERSRIQAAPPARDDALFEFDIDSCLVTRTTGHGDPAPHHVVWKSERPAASAE